MAQETLKDRLTTALTQKLSQETGKPIEISSLNFVRARPPEIIGETTDLDMPNIPKNREFRMSFTIKDAQEIGPGKIQAALSTILTSSPLLADIQNKDIQKISFPDVAGQLPFNTDRTLGFSNTEKEMLKNWRGGQEVFCDQFFCEREGLNLNFQDTGRIKLTYGLSSAEDIQQAKMLLEKRLPAIKEQLIAQATEAKKEDGTPALTPEQIKLMNEQLEIRVNENISDNAGKFKGEIAVRIGIPNPDVKLKDGVTLRLKESPLNQLPNLSDMLHQAFAYAGQDWHQSFPLLATPQDIRNYLTYRSEKITDPKAKEKIAELMKAEPLLSAQERKEKRARPGGVMIISSPTETDKSEQFEIIVRLPQGQSSRKVLESLATPVAAPEQDMKLVTDAPPLAPKAPSMPTTARGIPVPAASALGRLASQKAASMGAPAMAC